MANVANTLFFLLLAPLVLAEQTPCQECCSPGGTCDLAYKQKPGVCCGMSGGKGMCCPQDARCFHCNSGAYQCYRGSRPSCEICANFGGAPRGSCIGGRGGGAEPSEFINMLIGLAALGAAAMAVSACIRQRRTTPLATMQQHPQHQQVELQTAKPVAPGALPTGTPVATAYPAAAAYPAGAYPQPHMYPHHAGYSGGNVAMGAGMGFLGGMMVGEMMSGGHHGYGGDYGGGDYGGGGGDFGGGDAGFSADM